MTAECLGETCTELTRSKKTRLTRNRKKKSSIEKSHNWKQVISKRGWELSCRRSHNSSSLLPHMAGLISSSPQQQIQWGKSSTLCYQLQKIGKSKSSYSTVAKLTSRKAPLSIEAAYTASRGRRGNGNLKLEKTESHLLDLPMLEQLHLGEAAD